MYGTNPATGAPYPNNVASDLQTLMRAQFGNRVTVSDEGVPGSTLGSLMSGSDGRHPVFTQQMAQSKADIVVVNHGVNDSAWGGETTSQFWALLTQFVAVAQRHGKIVALEDAGPVCSPNYNVAPYVTTTDDVASQSGMALIQQYQALLAVPNYCSHLTGQYYPDPYVYSIKAQQEAAVLAPIVQKLLSE